MMFFRSVGAVFRGFSAFPEFAGRNPFRALFHLLLFCFLLSLVCSGIQTFFVSRKIDVCTNGLTKHFGKIEISDAGVLPTKNRNVSWSFYFPGSIRLDYFASGDKLAGKNMKEWEQRMGILWARRGFLVWMRPDASGTYYMMPYPFTDEAMKMVPSKTMFSMSVDQKTVENELNRYQEDPKVSGIPVATYEFSKIGRMIKTYVFAVLTLSSTFGNFVLTLILILLFSGLQALWKAPGLKSLKFGGTLSLLCYAAFPALVFRIVLESFSFPNAAEIVFYIVFFIYQMVAFHEVRRSLAESGTEDDSER